MYIHCYIFGGCKLSFFPAQRNLGHKNMWEAGSAAEVTSITRRKFKAPLCSATDFPPPWNSRCYSKCESSFTLW